LTIGKLVFGKMRDVFCCVAPFTRPYSL